MKHRSLFILLTVLALLPFVTLSSGLVGNAAPAAVSFTLTRLTDNTAEDTRPTLAVDGAGKAHVAFERGGDIYYATNSSGAWVTTAISTDPADEYRPAIALDGSGQAHVAYFAGFPPNLDIYHATNAGGAWSTEAVGNTSMPATWNLHLGLALDGAGRAYIAYHTYDGADYEVNIRHQQSARGTAPLGGWATLIVTDNAVQDEYPSIAVDGSGAIHVAYQSYDAAAFTYDVWYATYSGGAWNSGRVTDSAGLDDKAPSLALDGAGQTHLAWEVAAAMADSEIGYASNASGAWVTTTLTANAEHDTSPSLAVDGSGQAHIAYEYYDGTQYHIHYTSNAGGAWATDEVAAAPVQEAFLAANDHALAVDGAGYVHVTYFADDGSDDEVWYARSDQPVGPPANHAPYVPSDPMPPDQAVGVGLEDNVLSWSGGDPDAGDIVTYDIFFGVSTPPPLLQSGWPTTSLTVTLAAHTHYYWQVIARDDQLGTGGPVWEFTTGGESESYFVYLPFVTKK